MSARLALLWVAGLFLLAGAMLLGGCAIRLPEADVPIGRTGYSAFARAEIGVKPNADASATPSLSQWPDSPTALGLAK
jgi:hypothetical protein